MKTPSKPTSRSAEWQRPLAGLVVGFLLFETLSGLSIYLLPFSVTNQVLVLIHTVGGVIFLVPAFWYQLRHWLVYRKAGMTHVKLLGYLGLAVTTVALVSGLVLTYQAALGTRINYTWRTVHIISTFALVASVVPHIVLILFRDYKARANAAMAAILQAERRFGRHVGVFLGTSLAVVLMVVYAYQPVELNNTLPEDYNYLYGEDRPFAPSLAKTSTGGAFDARSMGGSKSCGVDGCHTQIVEEWEVSAHRYAAMDPAFRSIQQVMGEQNGAESTRYCGGCHDPISLFSGTKNLFQDELTNPMGLDEGVSCIACHSITETDVKGNADYTISQPERYMFELSEGEAARLVSNFLIRAYPAQHVETLQHRRFKSPEFCAACHKQFIDEEINQVGWVQLQNQYDNWRKSRWNHPDNPQKTIECRECHMPLVDSFDPASGDALDYNRTPDDGKHRSHRFLGANQYIPALLDLPGAEEHVALTEKWLRGEIEIPEIADKWRTGPAVPIEILAPEEVSPGENVHVEVVITNNKVGHDFPTGPLDIIQSWLEIEVTDQNGKPVFVSGGLDQRNFIEPGAFLFKAEPVDQYGKLIDRHNLWEMVGVRYRRSLFPGFSDKAQYDFACPVSTLSGDGQIPERNEFSFHAPSEVTSLNVKATLRYRKISQFLLNQMFGESPENTSRITDLSSDSLTIRVVREKRSSGADSTPLALNDR